MPTLTSIHVYPVKSLRGHQLQSGRVERMGLENDRRLMVVDPLMMFLTQREHARMALITPTLLEDRLRLSAPGMQDLDVPIIKSGQASLVEIWDSEGVKAIDQGEDAAGWISEFLRLKTRLVRIADDYKRLVDETYALHEDDHVGFADGYPLLIANQASLDDLNNRMETPIPMNRFRPNIVIDGAAPFAEDGWKRILIGETELALVKLCARCNIPTIDQDTAIASKEPNTTLSRYRKINGKVMFGVNIIPVKTGRLQVGDTVEILE